MNIKNAVSTTNPASNYHLNKAEKREHHVDLGIEIPEDSVEISEEAKELAKEQAKTPNFHLNDEQNWKNKPLGDKLDAVCGMAASAWFYRENGEAINEIYKEEYRNKNKKTTQNDKAEEINYKAKEKIYGQWEFNMDAFQNRIRDTLIKSINSKHVPVVENIEFAEQEGTVEVPEALAVPESNSKIEAAEVPEESDAEMSAVERLAQGLVDVAMSLDEAYSWDSEGEIYSFKVLPELSDKEYIELVRQGVEDGCRILKNDLRKNVGDISTESSKFINDVLKLAMKKFDDLLEQAKQGVSLKTRVNAFVRPINGIFNPFTK